jgi:hypothetical protein
MDVQGANDDTTQHDADRRIEEHGSLHFTNRRRLTSVELGRLIFSAFMLLVEARVGESWGNSRGSSAQSDALLLVGGWD